MELKDKNNIYLGLPGGIQIGMEHGQKLPKDYDHQHANPSPPRGGGGGGHIVKKRYIYKLFK